MENELCFETEDNSMTIEYLRARLLSERLVSRLAKKKADELAERVVELEEQLKVVHLRRKKTEKATSDVLVILGSLGFSDESEGCDPSSDQESTHPKGCNGKCLDKNTDNSRSMERPGHDLTMLSCRSLSWKSSRCSSQCERKFTSTPSRRTSGFCSGDFSSLRHRLGKSCCQSKRRDMRSTADESSGNDAKSEPQRANDDSEISVCNRDSQDEKLSAGNTASICITSPRKIIDSELYFHEDERDREMKRALERRADLICRHDENAQIEWEEKYREHNNSTPDSVEPGSQSDVTEERDERREPASDHVNEDPNARLKDARINEVCRILSNEDYVQGQPSPQTTVGPQKLKNADEGVVSLTSHPENAVLMNESKHTPDKPEHYLSSSSEEAATNANYYEGETSKSATKKGVCVSQEASKDLGSVLKALQLAKLSLQHKLRKLPLSEDGFKVKAVESQYTPAKAQMPASCAALFRVPTDLQTEENLHKSYLDSRSLPNLMHRYNESTSAVSLNNQFKLKPREGVTMSNASVGSSFDFANNWKTAISSLCNGDDCARSSSVLSENGFSNSDRYKLSPQFGTTRSSFTGSDGHAPSPLPDFHFGFLTNDFDGSSYQIAKNQSSTYMDDLHANRSSPTCSDIREISLQPKATMLSLINNGQIARNPYSTSSPTKLRVNTSSGPWQPFYPEPYYSCEPNISLSSNDRHVSMPSHPSIPHFKPAVPTFQGFPSFPPSSGSARDLTPQKLGTYGTLI